MRQAIADSVSLCFDELGQGEPLVLLHGSNADRRQFAGFMSLLGDGIRVLSPDQRDSPDSPCEARPYAMEDHARDLADFLTARGIDRAHVFGASYGGAVAMSFALLFPDRVQSLVLGATASERSRFHAPDLSAVRDTDPAAVKRFMLEAVVTPEAIDTDPELVAQIDALLLIREPASFARRAAAIDDFNATGRLGEITAPTLVLCGDRDPIAHAGEARALAAAIPGARFELLAGSRHGITVQYADRTARLIRNFVLAHAERTAV